MVVLRRMTVIAKLSKICVFLPRAFANNVCVCLGNLWRPNRQGHPEMVVLVRESDPQNGLRICTKLPR